MPLLWMETRTKSTAFFMTYAFYLAMSRGIVPGSYIFFRDGSLVRSFTLWVASAGALAFPWWYFSILPSDTKIKKTIKTIIALTFSMVPPLGVIGWGNPLTGAGLFFPGTGWYGLGLLIVLYIGAVHSRKWRVIMAMFIIFFTPLLDISEKRAEIEIRGVNTSFGRLASGSGEFATQYERERQVFSMLTQMSKLQTLGGKNAIIVLPETIIGRMNPTTQKRWEAFFERFEQTFIAGAEIPIGKKYDNIMLSFSQNRQRQEAKQRIPVPFSMYRPFSSEGANAYIFANSKTSLMTFEDKKIGFLICYEQFLTFPLLSLVTQFPDVIVASANLWWCKETSLPRIQTATVRCWAALFGLPLITTVNI